MNVIPVHNAATDVLCCLQAAAYAVETAEGRIAGVGHVRVDRLPNMTRGYGRYRYVWTLDGAVTTKARIFRKAWAVPQGAAVNGEAAP